MNYDSKQSDAALWAAAAGGDSEAEEILAARYSKLVKACARPYFLAGGDSEDLIQEGMLGLLSAMRQYDPNRAVAFATFAERCIRNRLLSAIQSASRFKHVPLNDYVSLESSQFDERQTVRFSGYLRDPEELLINRERFEEIMGGMQGVLSRFESEVLSRYLNGLSYAEIADQLGKTRKSVDNAVQRIRRKLAQQV